MGPLGTVSRFVAESLRGMKGVVASSSMGWGVARFMLVVAARESICGSCVELGEKQAVAALLQHTHGELALVALVAAGYYLWHSGRSSLLETAWSTAVAYKKQKQGASVLHAASFVFARVGGPSPLTLPRVCVSALKVTHRKHACQRCQRARRAARLRPG